MLQVSKKLGKETLSEELLSADKKNCIKIGPCGIGKEALYLGSRFIDRFYYLPWQEIRRVFKRVAMSPGGFSGKGIFGSISYLVVQYGNGNEFECRFRQEADIDRLLAKISESHPRIPLHSKAAEKKLTEAKAQEEARYLKVLSPEADASVKRLEEEKAFLEKDPSKSDLLTAAARQKRIIDSMPASFRIGGAVLGILGILCGAYGLYRFVFHLPNGLYFLIGGAAVFFLTLSTNTFPNRWNSRKNAEKDWNNAISGMKDYLSGRDSFSVPAQYAHPAVLTRMIRVIREGKAEQIPDALRIMKEELKALNSSVTVSQTEYDEVTAVKPMFLVCNYNDEL